MERNNSVADFNEGGMSQMRRILLIIAFEFL